MKKFIRNYVKKIIDRLFGSIIMEIVGEDKANHCTELVRGVIRESDLVARCDYDFDSFITTEDSHLDDFIAYRDFNPDNYDFDSFLTTQEFDPDDYVTRTHLQDEMDGFDPDDFVRCDDFDPDDFVWCEDFDPDDFVYTSDFDPDDYATKEELNRTQPTQREVISFLTKLTLCATDYCTDALKEGTDQ